MTMERMPQSPETGSLVTEPAEVGKYFMELMEKMEVADEAVAEGPYTNLKHELNGRIVGQEEAVESIIDALNQEEFRDPNKPLGTFMFLGPTGVGKSQTAKEVARLLHGGSDNAFLSINCAQYKAYGDVHVLQGAPPGYIGYDQPSPLKAEIINQPKSVILFDEVEKADPALHDFLMQILDEGEISIFNSGEVLSIRDSLIILTSNAGSTEINRAINKKTVGFRSEHQGEEADIPINRLTEIAFEALEKTFKPEFLGRIENKVLFTHLTDEQHALALDQYVKELCLRDGYVKRGICLNISPELSGQIVEGCSRRHVGGFREVMASFRKNVEHDLQRRVLGGSIPKHSIVYAVPASDATKEKTPGAVAEFRYRPMAA